jgi:opacity protein-like surface antigen
MFRFIKKIQLSLLLIIFVFISKAHSKDVYVKLELPIYSKYGGLDKAKHKQYRENITDNYGLGWGYNFSDYVEAEITFDQMKYSLYGSTSQISLPQKILEMPIAEENNKKSIPNIGKLLHRFAWAETRKCSGIITGHCSDIPSAFLTKEEVCSSHFKSSALFTSAQIINHKGDITGRCSPIWSSFFAKEELCPNPNPNIGDQSVINIKEEVIVQMKVNALIASVKFKLQNQSIFTPFVSLGAGVSHMRIHEDKISGSKLTQTSKNKTSFAYRVGLGAKVKIYSRIGFEVTARHFNYGQYKLSENLSKKITGRDVSAAIIINLS